ncbi:MAG: transposase, partial [Desulfobacteraceae bacterium]
FGKTLRAARKAYLDFVARGLPEGSRPELVGGGLIRSAGGWEAVKALRHSGMRVMGDERILGSGEFVESVLSHAREQYEKKTLARRSSIGLDTVIGQVAVQLGVDPARIGSAGRQRALARARSLVCALAMDRLGMNGRELARRLNLSASAVCKLAQRGRTDELNETSGAAIFKLQR